MYVVGILPLAHTHTQYFPREKMFPVAYESFYEKIFFNDVIEVR